MQTTTWMSITNMHMVFKKILNIQNLQDSTTLAYMVYEMALTWIVTSMC
jgi:hypothetical protein